MLDRPRPPDLQLLVPELLVLPAVNAAGPALCRCAPRLTSPLNAPSPVASWCFKLMMRTAGEHAKSVRDFFRDSLPPISDFRRFLFGFRARGGRSPARKTRCRSRCLWI